MLGKLVIGGKLVLGKFGVGEVAVDELELGNLVLGKLRWGNYLTPLKTSKQIRLPFSTPKLQTGDTSLPFTMSV